MLDKAQIKVSAGNESISLSPIETLPEDTLGEHTLSGTELNDYVRAEYSGFLGTAGEFYTIDTFRNLGDCDNAKTLPLSTDPGKDNITVDIDDSSTTPAIKESYPIRVTLGGAISTYTQGSTKQSNWDLCAYDDVTGQPYNYSTSSGACSTTFSLASPPSAKIDVLPSVIYRTTATTASDPTRILFYGRSLNSSFINTLITAGKASDSTTSTLDISFNGCMYNGGLVSLPASTEQVYLPIDEFNFQKGDIFSLGTRTGSYTALLDFYQGNIDAGNNNISMFKNVPNKTGGKDWRKLNVSWNNCSARADSGIYIAAIGDYGVFPGDEGIYGVVGE